MTAFSGHSLKPKRSVSWHPVAICFVALLGLFGLFFIDAFAPALGRFEHWTADWRTALLSHRLASSHPKLAIIEIDSDTLEPYPFMLPIDRNLQADIVRAVDRAGARAIALDFYYTKPTLPEADDKLIKTLKELKAKIILGAYENRYALKPRHLEYQYRFIEGVEARAGYLDLNPDTDGVIRLRAPPPVDSRYQEGFSALLGYAAARLQLDAPKRISWLLSPRDNGSTFLTIKAHKLLDGSEAKSAALLRDRVVIIAGGFAFFDRHRTPLSLLSGVDMSGAEIHAQMAAELIDGGRSYSVLTALQRHAFLAGMAVLGVVLGWRFRRRRFDFLDWRFVSLVVVATDAMLFKFAHLVLPFTLAAFAWVLSVTLGTQVRDTASWLKFKTRRQS